MVFRWNVNSRFSYSRFPVQFKRARIFCVNETKTSVISITPTKWIQQTEGPPECFQNSIFSYFNVAVQSPADFYVATYLLQSRPYYSRIECMRVTFDCTAGCTLLQRAKLKQREPLERNVCVFILSKLVFWFRDTRYKLDIQSSFEVLHARILKSRTTQFDASNQRQI